MCVRTVPVLSAVPNQQNLFPNPAKIADVLRYSYYTLYKILLMSPSYSLGLCELSVSLAVDSVYWGQHLAGVEDVVRVEQSLDSAHQPDERRALRHVQELRLHRTLIVSVSVSVGVRVSVCVLGSWLGLGLG